MAISVGATITHANNSSFGAPPSPSHTVDSGTTVTLIFVHGNAHGFAPSAVTLNGASATKLVDSFTTGQSEYAQIWAIANPSSGTISVTVGGNDWFIIGALNLKGADTSLTPDTTSTAADNTNSASLTASTTTTADGDILVCAAMGFSYDATLVTNNNGETTAYQDNGGDASNKRPANVNYFIQTSHATRTDGFGNMTGTVTANKQLAIAAIKAAVITNIPNKIVNISQAVNRASTY